ncbi:hypothetical protein SAMN05216489_06210 [Streptomyces sp. 3213]|uniref:hypothetical protein n=1 Tax=Streptomyces sp. 3213.3 TaxID=1855348 RepID=UPI00089B59A1|nr:hypothetical protein [Streptomyces sp. 3213.3]SEE32511.1 hypothetical protein SAMN05216489_06210 [Streptomyces sp. 3213] [Streptomyces sp. 3213.3]
MSVWKRAGIAVVLAAAAVGLVGPAASAAPAPWETSRAHRPAPTRVAAVFPAGEAGTVSVRCGTPCYQ